MSRIRFFPKFVRFSTFFFILQAFSDHSDSVSRRMGFIPLPLGVVMIRVIGTAVRAHTYGSIIIFMLAYFCLVTFRYVHCVKKFFCRLPLYGGKTTLNTGRVGAAGADPQT